MTCIVGLEHGGKVYIGGDSAMTVGWTQRVMAGDKVFINGPFAIGVCGSPRTGNLLQHALNVGEQTSTQGDCEYMATTFIDAVRKCFKDNGFMQVEDGVDKLYGAFLVGYRSKLYQVDGSFAVTGTAEGFDTAGSGRDIALGAVAASVRKQPEERICHALEIAALYDAGVGGPFKVVSV